MLRSQPVGRTEDPASQLGGQGGAEAQGVVQVPAGVAPAVEIQDHPLAALVPGKDPGTVKFWEAVPPDGHFPAMDELHQLPNPGLPLPGSVQIQLLKQRLHHQKLRPDKFRRQRHRRHLLLRFAPIIPEKTGPVNRKHKK